MNVTTLIFKKRLLFIFMLSLTRLVNAMDGKAPREQDPKWLLAKVSHLQSTPPHALKVRALPKEAKTDANKARLKQAFMQALDAISLNVTGQDFICEIDLDQLMPLCKLVHAMQARKEEEKNFEAKLRRLQVTPAEQVFVRALPYQKKESQQDIVTRFCTLPQALSFDHNGYAHLEGPIINAMVYNFTGTVPANHSHLDASLPQVSGAPGERKTTFAEDFAALDKALGHVDTSVLKSDKYESEVAALERAFELMGDECNISLSHACGPKANPALLYYLVSKKYFNVNKVESWGLFGGPINTPLITLAQNAREHPFKSAKEKFIILLKAGAKDKSHTNGRTALDILRADFADQERNNQSLGCTDSVRVGIELIEAVENPEKRNNMPVQEYLIEMEKDGATETEKKNLNQ